MVRKIRSDVKRGARDPEVTLWVVSVDIGQASVSQLLLQFDTAAGEAGATLERLPSKHPRLTAVPHIAGH